MANLFDLQDFEAPNPMTKALLKIAMPPSTRLIIVKVGTSSITTTGGKLDEDEMRKLVEQIATALKLADMKNQIVLVTSGAVAAGIAELGLSSRSKDIVFRQASAATGQSVLMAKYRELFKVHEIKVAQVLLTAEDLSNRMSYLHTRNVLNWLLRIGVVPIVNENDVTSIDELKSVSGFKTNFSDNDILSALLACAIKADLLVILSDVDGLYTEDPRSPHATVIRTVEHITEEFKVSFNESRKGRAGRGGIQSKIRAAEIAMKGGIPVVIANARRDHILLDVLAGRADAGTSFRPDSRKKERAMKMWIAYGASVKGRIFVNEGAKKAIIGGSSLLPVGITKVVGQFNAGDVVDIVYREGDESFAKGNPNYNSDEINMIKGLQVSDIKNVLGYVRTKEVVGRKKMHLLSL